MVNAQTWLDQNYPKEKRTQITDLDISNKNLEGPLNLTDFTHLQNLNISFNKLTDFYPAGANDNVSLIYENDKIKEIDCSYNSFNSSWGKWKADALTKLNFSNNNVNSSSLIAGNLAYLDASNNNLAELDLWNASQSLVELNCSGNHLTNGLNLTLAPNLVSFDCLRFKFDKFNTIPTATVTPSSALVSGLAVGTSLGGFLAIAGFCWVLHLRSRYIPNNWW